jgi:predicted ATP-grasp superfamily ATP-dependent carboligase
LNTKNILLTGARAPVTLDIARSLTLLGHNVICTDNISPTITGFSSYIKKSYITPDPSQDILKFKNAIKNIVEQEAIDIIIPTCEEALFVSMLKPHLTCDILTMDFNTMKAIHNKWEFYKILQDFSIKTPDSYLVSQEKDLAQLPQGKKIIFKHIYSRFSKNIIVKHSDEKLPSLKYTKHNPYIAQEFIEGDRFCSYSVAHKGQITASCEYKVIQSIGIGAGISLMSTFNKKIYTFIKSFVEKLNYTGQISFDFIKDNCGNLYCIECNPRATSGVHFFNNDINFARALLEKNKDPIIITEGFYQRELLFSLWYGIKQGGIFNKQLWRSLLTGKSPLFHRQDLKPSLAIPYLLIHIIKMTVAQGKGFHEVMSKGLEYNGKVL